MRMSFFKLCLAKNVYVCNVCVLLYECEMAYAKSTFPAYVFLISTVSMFIFINIKKQLMQWNFKLSKCCAHIFDGLANSLLSNI